MIRSFMRCSNIYRSLVASQTNYIVPPVHRIAELRQHNHSKPNSTTAAIPLNVDHEPIARFISFLHNKFNCPKEQAAEICIAYPDLVDKKLSDAKSNLELLLANGVRPDVILDNPRMLTRSHNQLCLNLDIVRHMNPKDINDFVPLVQVSTSKLLKLKKSARSEENVVPKKHRIYHFSDAMNIEPSTVTKFISRRLFILDSPFETIDKNLQLMLKYIAPIDILHDLWSFRYPPAVIEHRLNQAKLGDKKKIKPWMIRCPEERLLQSIKITADEKAIVGNKSTVNYLSDRLKYDVQTTEAIMQKHPKVYHVRVTRMKKILDYLLDEAGFSPVDIAQTPRIFCHSLQTTKKRLSQLKSLGCRPQSLVIVCKSANEYDKFVKNWINVREQLMDKNIIKV